MNKRYFLLPLLLICFLSTTACSDSIKPKLVRTYFKLFKPELYKIQKATDGLIDYINAKTALDNDIVFIYNEDTMNAWIDIMTIQTSEYLAEKIKTLDDLPYFETWDDSILKKFLSNALFSIEDLGICGITCEGGNVYSGVFLCGPKDRPIIMAIPFSAVVINGEVKQFNEITDNHKIQVWSLIDGTIMTKANYDAMYKVEKGIYALDRILDIIFGN